MTDADPPKLPYLPEDVLLIILELVEPTASPSTLASLARVSRSLHQKFIPLLYKSITLTQHNCSAFFYGLSSADTISEDERDEWWEGELEDKKSAVARRLAMLGYVQNLRLEDFDAITICHSAIATFLSLELKAPPKSWYDPKKPTDDTRSRRLLFHNRIPTNVHLSSNLLDSLRTSEVPLNTKTWWNQLLQRMLRNSGVLSIEQPEGPAMPYVSRCLEPICRQVCPRLLVLDNVEEAGLGRMLSASQRGVAIRFRDVVDVDSRINGQHFEAMDLISIHMRRTPKPLYYIIYNVSSKGVPVSLGVTTHKGVPVPISEERIRISIVSYAFGIAGQNRRQRRVKLKVVMAGVESEVSVDKMRNDLVEFMKTG
ncbi:hypothetical protein L198_07282 [Cryptococcus wingfieldii CBS 7118]|uniref:F-box domain-containing protein n=1 Tax=Cryptococcus wingfieldii CBS 7118 TaxID=1295528 RepID=A0A1E3IDL8_9TREE|nr:hypothetical protein L198_07282 [Cryptococcus wingfieldii CBS 7118]ODN86588.1 hypothetical protein L198_07282 [Cryptococcus wingfieldii CBS 7118]